jgi:multidrug efflux pump subunit AcrA (membrane-fusion protein)
MRARTAGTLWTVDAEGKLTSHPVKLGLADGQRTQVSGQGLEAGTSIVLSLATPGDVATSSSATKNPLTPTNTRQGPPGPF